MRSLSLSLYLFLSLVFVCVCMHVYTYMCIPIALGKRTLRKIASPKIDHFSTLWGTLGYVPTENRCEPLVGKRWKPDSLTLGVHKPIRNVICMGSASQRKTV